MAMELALIKAVPVMRNASGADLSERNKAKQREKEKKTANDWVLFVCIVFIGAFISVFFKSIQSAAWG